MHCGAGKANWQGTVQLYLQIYWLVIRTLRRQSHHDIEIMILTLSSFNDKS